MTKALEYTFDAAGGKLPDYVRKALEAAIARMDGKKMLISIRQFRAQRSNKQNRFYRGYVVPPIVELFRDHGDIVDEDTVHDYLMKEVGGYGFTSRLTGQQLRKSSRDIETDEWEQYMENIRAWAAKYDCQIPFPNEVQL